MTAFAAAVRALCGVGGTILVAAPVLGLATLEQRRPLQSATSTVTDSIAVTKAWARPALKGGTGGAYLTIENDSRGARLTLRLQSGKRVVVNAAVRAQ